MQNVAPRTWLAGLGFLGFGLLASGFMLEYGFGVLPCPMCWWQRYAHAAIAGCAALGYWANRPRIGAAGVVAAATAGLGVAAWQVAAQQGWLPYPPSCAGEDQVLVAGADLLSAMATTHVIPCDLETFRLLGFSLAAWNLPAMLLALGGAGVLLLKSR
ncbi:MAG: disulfide bond formation protein B [Alphaproteobacteria bacterium]|nr:disulfide bond formation protein B [Alphaproteobacteria bacterium]